MVPCACFKEATPVSAIKLHTKFQQIYIYIIYFYSVYENDPIDFCFIFFHNHSTKDKLLLKLKLYMHGMHLIWDTSSS
jgi:hypothetical protein